MLRRAVVYNAVVPIMHLLLAAQPHSPAWHQPGCIDVGLLELGYVFRPAHVGKLELVQLSQRRLVGRVATQQLAQTRNSRSGAPNLAGRAHSADAHSWAVESGRAREP
eukprot:scaffold77399_cov76-Phaeocystis_antarctica.AAC.3